MFHHLNNVNPVIQNWPFMTFINRSQFHPDSEKMCQVRDWRTDWVKSMFQDQFRENVHFKDGYFLRKSAFFYWIMKNSAFLTLIIFAYRNTFIRNSNPCPSENAWTDKTWVHRTHLKRDKKDHLEPGFSFDNRFE